MKKFTPLHTLLYISIPFIVLILTMVAYVFKVLPTLYVREKNAEIASEAQAKLLTNPAVDLSKVKTFEKLKADLLPSGREPVDKERVSFFENEKKEVFSYYSVNSAWAVAKFDGQKWVFLQAWNGSPDCLIFDKAGVPYQKSTIEFGCQIDGSLRAYSNPKDKKAYEEFLR